MVDPSPVVPNESIEALNARLATFVDLTLGFGVLEETTKQQLRVLSASPPFCACVRTTTEFETVENTAALKSAMVCGQNIPVIPVAIKAGYKMKVNSHSVREESAAVFRFKRIIAMRSMPIPRFRHLLPVKRETHLERGTNRWLVELYGNKICMTEYYGGEASIEFQWKSDDSISITRLVSTIQAAVADGKVSGKFMRWSQLSGFRCKADVKGFKVPDRIQEKLTTMVGAMELICDLSKLPIDCAVPVSRDTVPIQAVSGFPPSIQVETHIRECETLEKLTQVQLQIGKTKPLNDRAFDFVKHLKHTVEDASVSNRPVLPQLRELANTVAETLAQHGKRVEVYERRGGRRPPTLKCDAKGATSSASKTHTIAETAAQHGKQVERYIPHNELRLHTDNCDAKGVSAAGGEILCALTLGLATPGVRYHQSVLYATSPLWTVPKHYTADNFTQTYAVCGYYNRVKKLLCFNDNALLDEWHNKIKQLLAQA